MHTRGNGEHPVQGLVVLADVMQKFATVAQGLEGL